MRITNEDSLFIHRLFTLTLLLSEKPKLYTILACLSAIGLNNETYSINQISYNIYFSYLCWLTLYVPKKKNKKQLNLQTAPL